ncbi:MAG: hypothetical protein R3230_01125 [Nitrosopumilaceae archaeon]|nr:hypothetical protein [Nitrosopumilaceae archaeon]
MNAIELKKEFCESVFTPFNKEFMNHNTGLRYFTKRNPHFFKRIIDRNINPHFVKGMFTTFITNFHQNIMEICYSDASKMNSTNSVCIFVKSYDIAIVVILFDDRRQDNCFSMMPLTILDGHTYQKCDYEVDIDHDTQIKPVVEK